MWGQNDFGQLDAPPIPLRQINSHAYFTVGIDLYGNLRRWGNPPYPEPYVPATFVAGPFVEVRGRTTTCALRANGEIAIWPLDDQGIQCGLGSPPQGPFVQIAAGAWHAAALRADGSIVVWGCSFSPWNADPVNATPSGGPFRQIACGDFNTHAVRMDGTIASAGYSWDGANGSPSGGQFTKVAGGWGHALALRADGTIAAWGRNVQGECNVPAGQYVDIAAGAASSMALRQDGTVAIWGGCSSSSSGTVWNACSPPGILGPMQIEISGAQAGVVIDMLPCRAVDLFADRNVNGADLGILLSQWGIVGQYTVSDLDGSGSVDGVDLGLLLSSWGPCPY